MNFSSIKEYFYKLYNVCYLFLLLPLAIFIFIYYQLATEKITPIITDEFHILLLGVGIIVLSIANLTTVHWLTRKRLKKYAAEPGLGHKLDRYYEIIFLKFTAGAASSLMVAIGLLLTGNQYFPGVFIIILVWMAFQWPTSKKACDGLMLKGDEYKMVINKTEKI